MDRYLNKKTKHRRKKQRTKGFVQAKLSDLHWQAVKHLVREMKDIRRKKEKLEETIKSLPQQNPGRIQKFEKLERLGHVYNERKHHLKCHVSMHRNWRKAASRRL